ncbi:protein phosphatase 2C-like domain-containing protein 1 [Rhinatrema bivittatum]|uniref:protein phosphatase 2C-like domain-containing protein 1 n=1 Tax=Rhinatrema bivittatum TaxID=194408 RepID=UPI00112C4395|nr:protein phosphatase 2C-like domain-containing protein 1 [Rhinatrema bivittatum]
MEEKDEGPSRDTRITTKNGLPGKAEVTPFLPAIQKIAEDEGIQDTEFGEPEAVGMRVPCSICKESIQLHLLYHHRKQHRAQVILGYRPWDYPADMEMLSRHRRKIIRKLRKSLRYNERKMQKINSSFEWLKEKLMSILRYVPQGNVMVRDVDSSPVYHIKVSSQVIKALAVCEDVNTAWRAKMEDAFTAMDNYGNKPNSCFFGLFDGFHGALAASLASAELPTLILEQFSKMDSSYLLTEEDKQRVVYFEPVFKANYFEPKIIYSYEKLKEVTRKSELEQVRRLHANAFCRMDRLLKMGKDEVSKVRWSGCTAVTCIIDSNNHVDEKRVMEKQDTESVESTEGTAQGNRGIMHIANIGNIHAVLCKDGKGRCLTKEHSTSNKKERNRIRKGGASISTNEPWGLVEGTTRVTRALGCHGDSKLKKSVIPLPFTISIPIEQSWQFLILASSGLWEVLSKNEVAVIATKLFSSFVDNYKVSKPASNPQSNNIPIDIPDLGQTSQFDMTEGQQSESEEELEENESTQASSKIDLPDENETQLEGTGSQKVDIETMYDSAAAFISKQLVRSALLAGSQENVTVLVALLHGCDTILVNTKIS